MHDNSPAAEWAAYHAPPRHQPPLVSFIALFGVPAALTDCRRLLRLSLDLSIPSEVEGENKLAKLLGGSALATPRVLPLG